MTLPPEDPAPQTSDEPKTTTSLNLILDPVHYAALERLASTVHMKNQQVLRHLIRIADRYVHGTDSPFIDKLEGIFPKKKAG